MSIIYDEKLKTFHLFNENFSYIMKVLPKQSPPNWIFVKYTPTAYRRISFSGLMLIKREGSVYA